MLNDKCDIFRLPRPKNIHRENIALALQIVGEQNAVDANRGFGRKAELGNYLARNHGAAEERGSEQEKQPLPVRRIK
jgi:hypothetical protein